MRAAICALFTVLLLTPLARSEGSDDVGKSASEISIDPAASTPQDADLSDPVQASADPALLPETTIVPTPRRITLSAMGSFLGLAVPLKFGFGVAYKFNPRWTVEASYLGGSYGFSSSFLDIGSFHESIFIVDARYFAFHSFNLIFGLAEQNYKANVGSDILSQATQTDANISLIDVSTLGLNLGLGNRWTVKRVAIGVDWLVLNFPFCTLKNDAPILNYVSDSTTRSRIDGAMKIMRYLPTGAVLKFAFGITF